MNRRSPSPDFDPRIADWLETDPDNAPPAVLQTVLAAFPSIPQRRASRLPWRFTAMNRFAQLGAAAAIAAVLVAGAILILRPGGNVGTTTASLSPAASPSVSPGESTSAAMATACDLLTSAEVAASSGNSGLGAIGAPSRDGAVTTCRFANGAGDGILNLTLTTLQGRAAFVVASGASGVETIGGLGADAVFDPATATLSVAKGDAMATITWGSAGSSIASRRAAEIQLARVLAGRLPGAAGSPNGSSEPSVRTFARTDLEKDFVSTRYGYTVSYLPDWRVYPATKSWVAGIVNNWNTGYNDELKGPDIRFSGASQRLATGQSEQAWLTAFAAGTDQSLWRTVQIDGAIARIDADGVLAARETIAPGGRMFDAVVIKDGVAYNFNMDGNVDRATFEAVLSTIRLAPATVKP